MSNPAHYELRVSRYRDNRSKPKAPDLYVEVALGDAVVRTRTIKANKAPHWNETFTFSSSESSESATFHIRVRKATLKRWTGHVGHLDISISRLLESCACGEAELAISSSSKRGCELSVGVVRVYLRDVSAEERVGIDLENVRRSMQNIMTSAELADSTGVQVAFLVRKLDELVKATDDAVKIHPYLNLTWQAISVLYRIISHQFKQDQGLVDLVKLMEETFNFARDAKLLCDRTERCKEGFKDALQLTNKCCQFVKEYTESSFVGRAVQITNNLKISDYSGQFSDLKKQIDAGIALHVASRVDNIARRQQLEALERLLAPNKSDTSSRPRCLDGTRHEYQDQIKRWLLSHSTQNILWLNGIAGAGKSTIAATIMDYCDKNGCLAAFLFFQRGKDEHKSIIRSIAYQLAAFSPLIAEYVVKVAEERTNVTGLRPREQFEELLLGPLSTAGVVDGPVVIILDGLDECGSEPQRREILELLKFEFSKLPLEFRFLVTSRPENDIMKSLSLRQHVFEIKLDYTSKDSRRDVDAYIEREMRRVFEDILTDRPWADTMKVLRDASDGLFIWASTAVRMVGDSFEPHQGLQNLVSNIRLVGTFGIDSLYETVLTETRIPWEDAKLRDQFTRVLGLIVFAKETLSIKAIEGFLGLLPGTGRRILERLHSVLSYEPKAPVRLSHASFADYLTSPERSGSKPWHIDELRQKRTIAEQCFDVMSSGLSFNICDLETSFVHNDDVQDVQDRIKDKIPPSLEYACRFWAVHVCELQPGTDMTGLVGKLEAFVKRDLLYWLEVLSLTKHFDRFAGRALLEASQWTAPIDNEISSSLWSTYRLASTFAHPISQSTPHIYLSALSLWNGESRVTDDYSLSHPVALVHFDGNKGRNPCIGIFKGHTDEVTAVAFSPDGKHVVSGSRDKTIRVWDSDSGELVSGPFDGHTSWVNSVAFSPDGKRITSGSDDKTIRVWDANSGELVSGPFEGHINWVTSVSFSPDGKHVVSGSGDKTIRVWDADSGELVSGPFEGHTGWITSVSFSPDGKRVVSGSRDETIRVWDVDSGELVSGPFEGHTDSVNSVVFSPDGKRIVSGSGDKSIRVWDADSGEPLSGPFEGHTGCVTSVAFSLDGKRVVSGSDDETIRVWDADSGKLVSGPFEGHTRWVKSVAFSPDGKRITSGSHDKTIRVWDADSGKLVSVPFKGHIRPVTSVAFSPDGQRVVSGSGDETIRVWDVNNGELVSGPFEGHTDWVNSVAFSPDGKRVVSGSDDETIRVWDADSGKLVSGPFKGHMRPVASVAFSPDGKYVVSGSDDEAIRVWDADSGKLASGPFKGHRRPVTSVAFSPDGQRVVSGSGDERIRVWDANSGELVSGPFEGHINWVTSVSFSPDGKHVVSGSGDKTIRVWDADSGELVSGPFEGHTGWITSVSFSPDGKRVVSGSRDETIRVWDVNSGELVSGPFEGHTDSVNSVAFSPDGKYIVSGSDDEAIRVWDSDSGELVSDPFERRISFVTSVAFSPDGIHTASGSQDGTVRIWNAHIDDAIQSPSGNLSLLNSPPFPNWSMSDDGWVLGERGELLIWIPEDMRRTLLRPQNTALFSIPYATKLDFTRGPLGKDWYKGFPKQQ